MSDRFRIHDAAKAANVTEFEAALAANPKASAARDDDDRMPLHWAASANSLQMVDLLAKHQPRFDVDAPDGNGWTALMIAASLKNGDDLVEKLIGLGADVNAKNDGGQTAMHLAISKNNPQIVRILLSHNASVRVKDRRGQLPLHRAAGNGSIVLIGLLVGDGGSPVNATDSYNMTALHYAIADGNGNAAIELLKRGADPTKEDADGKTPVDLAPDDKVRSFIKRQGELEGFDI